MISKFDRRKGLPYHKQLSTFIALSSYEGRVVALHGITRQQLHGKRVLTSHFVALHGITKQQLHGKRVSPSYVVALHGITKQQLHGKRVLPSRMS